MAIIKLVCTRKVENANITFGQGVYGALTTTGEIYEAEGYRHRYTNEHGLTEFADLSNELIGCVGTVTFIGNQEKYSVIKDKVANHFKQLAEMNSFDIKVGLVLKIPKISKTEGEWNGEWREGYQLSHAELLDIEIPELTEEVEDIIQQTSSAKQNAKERKTSRLAAYLANGLKKSAATLGKSIFSSPIDASSSKQAEEFAKELEKKKTSRTKTKC